MHRWIAVAIFLGALAPLSLQTLEAGDDTRDGFIVSGITVVGGELEDLGDFLDPIFEDAFTETTDRILIEFLDLDDDTYEEDDEIQIAFYGGADQDDDPTNDFDGGETFTVQPDSFNDDGDPLVLFEEGSLLDYEFEAGPEDLDLSDIELPDDTEIPDDIDLEELLVFEDVVFAGTVEDSGDSLTSDPIETSIHEDVFDAIEAPFPASLLYDTVLDWMTAPTLFGGLGLDQDVDSDGDGTDDSFSIELEMTAVSAVLDFSNPAPIFRRGDVDGNGSVSALVDAIRLLEWQFSDGDDLPCYDAADIDGNGTIGALTDAIYVLFWQFSDGDDIPDPGPSDCGVDPEDNDLDCLEAPDCE